MTLPPDDRQDSFTINIPDNDNDIQAKIRYFLLEIVAPATTHLRIIDPMILNVTIKDNDTRECVCIWINLFIFYVQCSSLPHSEVNFGIAGGMKDGEIPVQRVEEGESFTVTVSIDGSPVLDDDFVLGFAVQIQDQFGNIIFVENMTTYPSYIHYLFYSALHDILRSW